MVSSSRVLWAAGRAVRNAFFDDVKAGNRKPFKCPYHCIITCDIAKKPYSISLALANAQQLRLNDGFAFCESNANRATEIASV